MTDNIPALERAVAEANAKVAEVLLPLSGTPFVQAHGVLVAAVRAHKAALAALDAARKPKPLTVEEAGEIVSRVYDGLVIGPVAKKAHQALLDATAERWLKVILHEVGKLDRTVHPRDSEDTATVNAAEVEAAIRRAMRGDRS